MNEEEIAAFEANPFHNEAVQVRIWDDGGKVPGMKTRAISHYTGLLQRVVDSHLAAQL